MQIGGILEDLSMPAVRCALEANVNAQLPLMYAHMPGMEVIDEADLLCMTSDLPDVMYNAVYRAAFPVDQAASRVEAVVARYRSWQRLPLVWVVAPSTEPPDLGRHLEARGFSLTFRGVGMAADLRALEASSPPPGLAIERVRSEEQLEQWLHPVAIAFALHPDVICALRSLFAGQGFGSDRPWHLFVGYVDGRPVAASRLFCAAGVAGIYHVAVVPGARRRGYGTAMTVAAADTGRELGYGIGILTASPEGYAVYQRLGFEECVQAGVYIGPEAGASRNGASA